MGNMKGCGLKNAHPTVGFVYFLFVFILSLAMNHPVLAAVNLLSAAFFDVYLRGKCTFRAILLTVLPLLIVLPLINGLFNHYGVTVLFVLKSGNNFTLEALVYGLFLAVKFACFMLWLDCFNEIIDGDKFIFLFGRFSPKTALVISMTLRFLPMLREGFREIETARKGIGFSSSDNKLLYRLKNSVHNLSILITWVLESAIDTAYSMKARGYGLKGRTSYSKYIFTAVDFFELVAVSVVFLFSSLSVFGLDAVYNPVIEIDRPDIVKSLSAVCYFLLCLFPYAADMREKRICKPKERKPLGLTKNEQC